jgi:hypothetical protein
MRRQRDLRLFHREDHRGRAAQIGDMRQRREDQRIDRAGAEPMERNEILALPYEIVVLAVIPAEKDDRQRAAYIGAIEIGRVGALDINETAARRAAEISDSQSPNAHRLSP